MCIQLVCAHLNCSHRTNTLQMSYKQFKWSVCKNGLQITIHSKSSQSIHFLFWFALNGVRKNKNNNNQTRHNFPTSSSPTLLFSILYKSIFRSKNSSRLFFFVPVRLKRKNIQQKKF